MPHIEVLPNAKQSLAPGWAYVPDTGYDPSRAPLNPSAPRRLRASTTNNITGVGYGFGGVGAGAGAGGGVGAGGVGGFGAAAAGATAGTTAGVDGGVYDDMMDIDGVGGKIGRGDGGDFYGGVGGMMGGGGRGVEVGWGLGLGGKGAAGLSARQRGVVLKRLAEMDRDGGGKDVALPREYTVAGGAGAGGTGTGGTGGSSGLSVGARGMF